MPRKKTLRIRNWNVRKEAEVIAEIVSHRANALPTHYVDKEKWTRANKNTKAILFIGVKNPDAWLRGLHVRVGGALRTYVRIPNRAIFMRRKRSGMLSFRGDVQPSVPGKTKEP